MRIALFIKVVASLHLTDKTPLEIDYNDWQLDRQRFLHLQRLYGPFNLDGACDDEENNAHVAAYYSPSNRFLDAQLTGKMSSSTHRSTDSKSSSDTTYERNYGTPAPEEYCRAQMDKEALVPTAA